MVETPASGRAKVSNGAWGLVSGSAVLAIVLALAPLVFSSNAVGTNCSYDSVYQTKQGNVWTPSGVLYVQVNMWAHWTQVRFNCVQYYHYAIIQTYNPGTLPRDWSVLVPSGGYGDVNWWTYVPSWNTFSAEGSPSFQNPSCQTSVPYTAPGVNWTEWNQQGFGTGCSGWYYEVLSGMHTNTWYSGYFGRTYVVAMLLQDTHPDTVSQPLYLSMTS